MKKNTTTQPKRVVKGKKDTTTQYQRSKALSKTVVKEERKKDQRYNRNPSGKGGFQERPEDRGSSVWDKRHTISFQMCRMLRMEPKEFENFFENEEDITQAMVIAHERVRRAKQILPEAHFVADRIEGKAKERVELETKEEQKVPTKAEREASKAYLKALEENDIDF